MGNTGGRNADGEDTSVRERQAATLRWFVTRARRVEEHSLAADKAELLALGPWHGSDHAGRR